MVAEIILSIPVVKFSKVMAVEVATSIHHFGFNTQYIIIAFVLLNSLVKLGVALVALP
ncbi:hypothetical protein NT6N_01090 [Oceaniferula spumae]|uniref:Uncharacterized protein n=1 Tax=Oceaniferula spumae TaxID=2979115 RepID=A0AAT9FGG6_9BACT